MTLLCVSRVGRGRGNELHKISLETVLFNKLKSKYISVSLLDTGLSSAASFAELQMSRVAGRARGGVISDGAASTRVVRRRSVRRLVWSVVERARGCVGLAAAASTRAARRRRAV